MARLLDNIDSPQDLKKLSQQDLYILAAEIRDEIVATTSQVGGHLASSLGAVDIAIAIHYVFDTPKDKIIWDVGHQAYAHKILTERRDTFKTIRQLGGISGFPKPSESIYDAFGVGHSSTSISAAMGMVVARDLNHENYKVIAIIGDGSLTAGLAFEGLNQAGHLKKDIIVVLNDNEMSISQNVGALSSFLSRKITGRLATRLKKEAEGFFMSIPRIGSRLVSFAKRAEDSLIALLTPGMLFEGLGFHYIGPIDGHNIDELISTFSDAKELKGPILIHVLTKKGKGYLPAEQEPVRFHGIGPFEKETGKAVKSKKKIATYTEIFGQTLIELSEKDKRIVAITAAMPEGTGLDRFAQAFPERFFDVGIAEQHAVTFAAGLSKQGFIPVVAIYSTFLQRAYDEILHDVCLQNLPVVFAIDRAGIVGADGPTHHGLFDLSYLRHMPDIVVMAPKDEGELRHMLKTAVECKGPVAVRYPKGEGYGADLSQPLKKIAIGQSEILRDGNDAAILAIGSTVYSAIEASVRLEKQGLQTTVVNSRFVKPMDEDTMISIARKTDKIITVEENVLQGGFGSAVLELLEQHGITECKVKRMGIADEFVEHGSQKELRGIVGIDAQGIEKTVAEMIKGQVKHEGKASERKRAYR
ncbi:MAG: 1-deoxy-D-xylulose-5-phosphate synthase [Deltaproteobacteria bacterium]|nr:1-deoxy-D-xylulose-5-phosphate synthase [Deltaproteobacteria bacterium]